MNLNAIPVEMRAFNQWVGWKFEFLPDVPKPTKVPYNLNTGYKASPTDPAHWSSFAKAVAACPQYDGIGFVITRDDPYTCIDLDDTAGDSESFDRQLKIYEAFDSYAETSPSGKGSHIWIKGEVESGRKRSYVEIYPHSHFMTMTGDVCNNKPIMERQDILDVLWKQMGGEAQTYIYEGNAPEKQTDEQVIEVALKAKNGEKFASLARGEWQGSYPSPSEADQAIINIISFYTQNAVQIARIFRSTELGKRKKANRQDYVNNMIRKSFDRLLPAVDIDGLRDQLNAALAEKFKNQNPFQISQISPTCCESENPALDCVFVPPPGLTGDIARFIYDAAPIQVPEIALIGAIGLMAGICGRAYNISRSGLNLYLLALANTGMGKDAASNGIDKLMSEVKLKVPNASEFIGPETVSPQAVVKHMDKTSLSFVSIVGEFGLKLKTMSSYNASPNDVGLKRLMLILYSKSAQGLEYQPMIYSDSVKNTKTLIAPSYSIIGESTPERFYENLTEIMITEGLLPRFLIIEHKGKRPYLNENHIFSKPSIQLIEQVAALSSNALMLNHSKRITEVSIEHSCVKTLKDFMIFCTDEINKADSTSNRNVIGELWNRAHLKLLRLSGLIAVGCNPYYPSVSPQIVDWSMKIILQDVRNMISKFESGTVGEGCRENKQIEKIYSVLRDYVSKDWNDVAKYKVGNEKLHYDKVIPYKYINKRLACDSNFTKDKLGATNAIKRVIETMKNNGDIEEVQSGTLRSNYGFAGRCFVLTRLP